MFSAFGSMLNDDMENGLIENFANHKPNPNSNKSDCFTSNDKKYCLVEDTNGDDEVTSDEEEAESKNEEKEVNENEENEEKEEDTEEEEEEKEEEDNGGVTTSAGPVDEEEEESEEEDEENNNNGDNFTGSMKEHFTNNNEVAKKALSMNLFLKAILFTCLFYILAHNDTRDFVVKKVFKSAKAVKSKHYLYIAMVLFFIVFYILSIFL
tara:strand:+ start:63 stop:689 length:627 start_codon:yes stop_codon:yes gene_type:complete